MCLRAVECIEIRCGSETMCGLLCKLEGYVDLRAAMRGRAAGVLTAILWLVLCVSAGARIGETLDQVLKRDGRCLKTVTAENGKVYKLFSESGFKVLVHFYQGKVDEISYDKGTDIFDDELKALMQDNAPGQWVGSGWPVNSWHNASGITARYSFEHRLLLIMTDAALERERK
jgi:hypothetical protein